MDLDDKISKIKGIGAKKEAKFNRLGIETVYDLLQFFPVRYENRSRYVPLSDARSGDTVFSAGEILSVRVLSTRKGMFLTKVAVAGGGGSAILTLFNNPYFNKSFHTGDRIQFYGTCKISSFGLNFEQPVIERAGKNQLTGRIYPIYSLTNGLTNTDIINAVSYAIDETFDKLYEYLPDFIMSSRKMAPRNYAIRNIHFPLNLSALKMARYRIIYEEFFTFKMQFMYLKSRREGKKAFLINPDDSLSDFQKLLSFKLTNSQINVMREIGRDMCRTYPMERLLQGDVGSGKTVVAFYACFLAIKNGYQAAFMAPTEILAKQHYDSAKKLFEGTDFKIEFLSGSVRKKEKELIYSRINTGECNLVIGTHALLEEDVSFYKAAIVITDEQHRFGVKQRKILSSGYDTSPHSLVMTATPIPRTLALAVKGELDFSVIDELPVGRKHIITKALPVKSEKEAYSFALKELETGGRVYIVCPLISESEKQDLKSAENLVTKLQTSEFKNYEVALLHGKMADKEKICVMNKFISGDIQVLVSTTVIEVGVDVPEASVMIVENAERFGLSQLHQLRGRVGRSDRQSYCILLYNLSSDMVKERMDVMVKTDNGFEIAEKDLVLRGSGEIFGLRQHGMFDFKVADFLKHRSVFEEARDDAESIDKANLTSTEKLILQKRIEHIMQNSLKNVVMN